MLGTVFSSGFVVLFSVYCKKTVELTQKTLVGLIIMKQHDTEQHCCTMCIYYFLTTVELYGR